MIQFSKGNKLFPILSLLVILILYGVTYGYWGGFNKGIDFTSGLTLQVQTENPISPEEIRASLSEIEGVQVQRVGDKENDFSIRSILPEGETTETFSKKIVDTLESTVGNLTLLSSNFIGPRLAVDLTRNMVWLVILTLGSILLYITIRFKFIYGVGALTALIHDVFIVVGLNGAFQIETSAVTIAAVLTIIGYSLNDTVVIFDRIRENVRYHADQAKPFSVLVDESVNKTLTRTLITSLTTILAVIPLYLFSSGEPKRFALNLGLGIIVGTYSSIFIANPVLVFLRHKVQLRHDKHQASSSKGVETKEEKQEKVTKHNPPSLAIQQSAEDIRLATEARKAKKEERRKRAKKKK